MAGKQHLRQRETKEWVAIILAIGFAVAFNCFSFAVLYDAIKTRSALSENATQVLTGWGGGIIGVLGAYIGYRVSRTPDIGPYDDEPPDDGP
jgi:hypothetical protein